MKTIKESIVLLAICLITFSVYSQKGTERSLDSFSKLSVGEAITVYLIQGATESATIKSSNIDLEDVLTDVSGDRLKIHLEGSNHRNVDVTVHVNYKNLEEVSVSSAADLFTEGPIKGSYLSLSVSSAGDAEVEVDVDKLNVDISSAGDLTVKGNTDFQKVEVSSAGEYRADELTSRKADVRTSSAGSARLNVREEIEANASSGGSIKYTGDPQKVFSNASSGGSVKGSR